MRSIGVPILYWFSYILKTIKNATDIQVISIRDTLCALFIAKSACPLPENRSAKTELNLALLVDFWAKNDKIIKI